MKIPRRKWNSVLLTLFYIAAINLILIFMVRWYVQRPNVVQIERIQPATPKPESEPTNRTGPPGDVLDRLAFLPNPFALINNETGADEDIVPNIVHFIVMRNPEVSFLMFVSLLACLRNHNPDKIYIHSNVQLKGKFWDRMMRLKEFTDKLILKDIVMPTEIFGQPIAEDMQVFHGGDIARIRVLMEYGGIFLDNDSYVVRSLNPFRKFEFTIGWDEGQFLGTQIILAHKQARFLDLWLHTYDGNYKGEEWYYNAGELPTKSVLWRRPDLIHRVKVLFGNDIRFQGNLFQRYWPAWRKHHFTFHLLIRRKHQAALHSINRKAKYPVEFDDVNLQDYPITFREMANEVLDFEKALLKHSDLL
ncbi:uncharacterized protein [Bemisia tabaci]